MGSSRSLGVQMVDTVEFHNGDGCKFYPFNSEIFVESGGESNYRVPDPVGRLDRFQSPAKRLLSSELRPEKLADAHRLFEFEKFHENTQGEQGRPRRRCF